MMAAPDANIAGRCRLTARVPRAAHAADKAGSFTC